MKFEDLKKYIGKTVRIKDKKDLAGDIYAEPGMIGRIHDVKSFVGDPDVVVIKIDWNGFEKHNAPFESKEWYVGSGTEQLGTMKEAGLYPKDGIESVYAMKDDDVQFEVIDENVNPSLQKARENYERSGSEEEFMVWLAQKAGF